MVKVEMLPAGHGDALLIEYGDDQETHRILIDGGPYYAYEAPGGLRDRLQALIEAEKPEIELLIVTHVDTDHIDGVIRLLHDPKLDGLEFKDIWFNGWKHLQPEATGVLAGVHGEYLGALLTDRRLPWNAHPEFEGGPVVTSPEGGLPKINLAGDATITVLSPGPAELDGLRRDWTSSLNKAGFRPGDTKAALEQLQERARYAPPKGVLGDTEDTSAANGSSIAALLEHGDDRVLLAGDAWPSVLVESLGRWAIDNGGPLEVRDFKISHHGSFGNQSEQLIKSLRTKRYLISSSGAYYRHPDRDSIRLILMHDQHAEGERPELVFNYLSPSTKPWASEAAQEDGGYVASFPTGAVWEPK